MYLFIYLHSQTSSHKLLFRVKNNRVKIKLLYTQEKTKLMKKIPFSSILTFPLGRMAVFKKSKNEQLFQSG